MQHLCTALFLIELTLWVAPLSSYAKIESEMDPMLYGGAW